MADSTKAQKSYLSANWPIRASPALVMVPNAVEVNVILAEGVGELFCPWPSQPSSRLVQFIRLKYSALNVNLPLSPRNGNVFTREKSFWRKPGPIREFRGTSPNCPGDGKVYAAGLKYAASNALRERLVDRWGFPLKFGRSLGESVSPPIKAASTPEMGVEGK